MPIPGFKIDRFRCGESAIHLLHFSDFVPEDYMDHLTPDEQERLFAFKSLKRQREFVATRILRHHLFGFSHIHYTDHGAPYIYGEGFLSISHAKQTIGIALNQRHPVGLDLEPYNEKILALADKFLSVKEKSLFDHQDKRVLTSLWSSKETLYKLAGRKQILFKEQLLLRPVEGGHLTGFIDNFDHVIKVDLHIFDLPDYVLTINATAPVTLVHDVIQSI